MTLRNSLAPACVALCLLIASLPARAADKTDAPTPRPLTLERLYSLPWVTGTQPVSPAWSPDSRRLAFLWNDEGTPFRDIWMTDAAGAKPVRVTTLPRPESPADPGTDITRLEQVERAETDDGISELAWAPDGRHLLFILHGRIYRVLPGEAPQPLGAGQPAASDLAASTPARAIAWLAAGDLWVMDWKSTPPAPRKLRAPGRKDVGVESFAWSADGRQLAFVEADASQVPTRGIPDYLGEATRLVEVKRAFPGEPSPTRRLGVIAAAGGEVRWMDLGDNPLDQIFSVRWSPDGKQLLVDKSDLYIKDRRLLVLDPDTGKARLLVHEADAHNVTAEWWADWAPDGEGVYFTSDRGNDYHVYHQALAGGEPKAITKGDWAVFSASISPAAKALFVVGNEGNAESRRVYRVALDGGHPAGTDAGRGRAPSAGLARRQASRRPLFQRCHAAGPVPAIDRCRHDLERTPAGHAFAAAEFGDYHWVAAKYVVFPNVNDATPVHARLTLPPDFDAAKKYPAILGSVYSNSVHNEWGGRVYHPTWGLDQFLAQQGYVVMNVDISGSSGHGKAFRQRIREDYGGVDVDDLYSGTRWLVDQGFVDAKRIGIWGSSYGGLLTAMSMFRYPDAYQAGVAGAPATNVFHALTGEMQTMMAPQDHQAQYEKSSAYLRSGDLKGHLMLIHGMRDNIVLFKDSVTLVQRLILQGKDVDFVVLPNAPHGWDTHGLAQTRYAFRKLYEHFQRYLAEKGTEEFSAATA